VPMPSTMWTTILQFHEDPERVKDFIVRRYREPIVGFARRQGLSDEDSEDIAQEVFIRVCHERFLNKANEIRGKFRTVLLAVTKHVISSFWRWREAGIRDRRREIPLGEIDLPEEVPADPEFDRLWVKNLVEQALARLQGEPAMVTLQLQMEGRTYDQIAEKLGMRVTDVTNRLHRARECLRREIEQLIAEYSSREDVADEIAALRRYL